MPRLIVFSIALTFLAIPLSLGAAGPDDLEQEYQQVRKIALRDPKVVAAYEEADQRLNAKIVQIDPALAAYTATRTRGGAAPVSRTASRATPSPKAVPAAKAPIHTATHVVAKGETLGGIASQHGVTVGALKAANHIEDERKLPVGQVLTIPGAKKAAPAAKSKGWWDKLTS